MAEQTLKEVANQALVSLIQNATDALTFLKGEVPLAVKELLTYNTFYLALLVCVGFLFVAIGMPVAVRASIRCAKHDWYSWYDRDTHEVRHQKQRADAQLLWTAIPRQVIGYMASIVGVPMFFANIEDLLKITLAPRIWLLEYASSLVK